MAEQRGKRTELADDEARPKRTERPDRRVEEAGGPLEEIMRRAIALGLSGFFTTEGALRKALGETVPKDWTDFFVDTSERTRSEFLERLSHEIGRVIESVDIAAVLRQLLEGRTLEVKAEFRLSEDASGSGPVVRFAPTRGADAPGDDE